MVYFAYYMNIMSLMGDIWQTTYNLPTTNICYVYYCDTQTEAKNEVSLYQKEGTVNSFCI